MPGCLGDTWRFFRCGGRRKTPDETKSHHDKKVSGDLTSRAGDANNTGQVIEDTRSSVPRKSIASSNKDSGGDFSDKTELEQMFESLMNKLHSATSQVSEKKPEEEIVLATETLLPILRLDFEDGRQEDLLDVYKLCNDIMEAAVINNDICEFIVLANQRLLVWDVLDPSAKLLSLSMSYLKQFPATQTIARTRSLLEFCKADLCRRRGRLNEALRLVMQGEENLQTPDDYTLKTYGLTIKSLTLSNMLQKDEAAREAEVALKILRERKDSYSNAVKSELAFIFRVRSSMGALKVLEEVCGISLRNGDEQSVRVRNAKTRLGMWHFLDANFDKSFSLWKSVLELDKDLFGDAMSWPPGATVESIIGLNYLGFDLSNLDEYNIRTAALKALLFIHFFRQQILGSYHPSAKFIQKWLEYYILQ